MDKTKEFMTIAEEKIGIIVAKRLFCVLPLLFEIDRKIIVEKLGVSRLTVKKYGTLIESGNMRDIFADTVCRRRSEMEDFREETMAEPNKKPARTLREAAAVIEEVSGLKRISAMRKSHGTRERTRHRADIPPAVFPESEPDRAFLETGKSKSA